MCTWPCRKWSVCFEVCLIKPSEVAFWTQCMVIKCLSLVWPTFQRLGSGRGRGWVVRGGGSSSALGGNCVHALMPHARIYTLFCSITSLIHVTATLNTPSFLSPRFQLLRGLEPDSPANSLTCLALATAGPHSYTFLQREPPGHLPPPQPACR